MSKSITFTQTTFTFSKSIFNRVLINVDGELYDAEEGLDLKEVMARVIRKYPNIVRAA